MVLTRPRRGFFIVVPTGVGARVLTRLKGAVEGNDWNQLCHLGHFSSELVLLLSLNCLFVKWASACLIGSAVRSKWGHAMDIPTWHTMSALSMGKVNDSSWIWNRNCCHWRVLSRQCKWEKELEGNSDTQMNRSGGRLASGGGYHMCRTDLI